MATMIALCAVLCVGVLQGIAGEQWKTIGEVCFESKGGKPGVFKLPEAGFLQGFRMTHTGGAVTCSIKYPELMSKWGCYTPWENLRGKVSVIVSDASNNVILPIEARYENQPEKGHHRRKTKDIQTFFYSGGNSANSSVLAYYDDHTNRYFDDGAELKLWYGEDFYDRSEDDNAGKSCGMAEVLYME